MNAAVREANPRPLLYLLLVSTTMACGWGYRGTVGHEAGAMVPGALLGMVLCLASERPDLQRRAAVAGLFGAVGWAWGGSLSYMEQTLYVLSDSLPDVLYGYAMLFFLGALWAGVGGAVLGLALTEPRSELERLARPFTAICAAFFAAYLYFLFLPGQADAYETFTVREFNDADWLAATITVAVSGVYWLLRPKDRRGAALLFWGAAAWWAGYLCLTKFGGLRLGPLHRSEGWGGIVGVLAVLILHLVRRRNRAALMLCLYGILGGGLAFMLAVFIRHPLAVHWGPFPGAWPQWRTAEDSFGFLMGLTMALGVRRLLRGGLAPPLEDTPTAPLNAYAAFVILVALPWMNFRRHAAPWLAQADGTAPFPGSQAAIWLMLAAAVATLPLLLLLWAYLRGNRRFLPASAFSRGAAVTLLLLWLAMAGYAVHQVPNAGNIRGHLLLWIPAFAATCLLLLFRPGITQSSMPENATVPASSPKWGVGAGYACLWAAVPVVLCVVVGLSMAMQQGPMKGVGRKRFGPDAYWRQTARLVGAWRAVGNAQDPQAAAVRMEDTPVKTLEFDESRNVTATMPSGEVVADHQWFLKDQYTWLRWHAKPIGNPECADTPLKFRGNLLYIAWPPGKQNSGFLVFERVGG